MAFLGNTYQDWDYLKRLARDAGDRELYEFAEMMEREEKKWEGRTYEQD